MQNFTVKYYGLSGVDIKVYKKDKKKLITTFKNVRHGEELTVNGFDKKGRLDSKTYLKIGRRYYEIHTSCSENILGESYGPFTVTAYTDGEGTSCTQDTFSFSTGDGEEMNVVGGNNSLEAIMHHKNSDDDDDDDDDDEDDDQNSSCQCEGKMQNFTVQYLGPSGATIKAFKKDKHTLIESFEGLDYGDVITVNGFDSKGRLESKTFLSINNGNLTEIHTSCSINILGETYGLFKVTAYTDGEGSSCSIDNNPPSSNPGVGSSCEATAAENGGHAMWLSNYIGSSVGKFFFESNSGSLEQLGDGSAMLTGIMYNQNDANDKWQVEVYLTEGKTWSEWQALGRGYKDERNLAGNAYLSWTYYIMDPEQTSKLIGLGSNAGEEKSIMHMPGDYHYGFQVGQAANSKNSNYGLSGWFFYRNNAGQLVQGDFNVDLINCIDDSGNCSAQTTEYTGEIIVCFNGESRCVSQSEAEHLLAQGGTLGACPDVQIVAQVIDTGGLNQQGQIVTENEGKAEISAYPNPAVDYSIITFSLTEAGHASVGLFDTQGNRVAAIFDGEVEANKEYAVEYNTTKLRYGIYLVRVASNGYVKTKKLLIRR